MSELVDGYELKYLMRTQTAERRVHGRLVDTVPVAWASSWRSALPTKETDALPTKSAKKGQRDAFVEIGFGDAGEMAKRKAASEPFVVAVAHAQPKGEKGRTIEFRGVFEVTPTGVELSPNSIETRVIRRMQGEG